MVFIGPETRYLIESTRAYDRDMCFDQELKSLDEKVKVRKEMMQWHVIVPH